MARKTLLKERELIAQTLDIMDNQLSKINKDYLSNIAVYMRISSIHKSTLATEEKLNELANDILQAEQKGLSAEDFLGSNPVKFLDNIIKELPKGDDPFLTIPMLLQIVFLFLVTGGISGGTRFDRISNQAYFSPIALALMIFAFLIAIFLIFFVLRFNIKKRLSAFWQSVTVLGMSASIGFLIVLPIILHNFFLINFLEIPISNLTFQVFSNLFIVGIAVLAIIFFITKRLNKND